MSSLYFLAFAALGILYSAYLRHRSESNRLTSLQKRHELQNPTIEYEYDRFNTKEKRNTSISITDKDFNFITDIQHIRIANQTFVSKISSEYEEIPIQFDLVIQPFEKVLFDIDGYTNFNQEGILILWSYGAHTKFPIEQIEEFDFLIDVIPTEPNGVYLNLDSFIVDKSDSSVVLNGKFKDGSKYVLTINYKSYILKFKAQLNSIMNFENFRSIDELNKNET